MRTLLVIALVMSACGHSSDPQHEVASGAKDELPEPTVAGEDKGSLSFVVNTSDLPTCNADNEGKVVYVKASNTFHGCHSGNWETLDFTGPAGKDGANGNNGKDGADGTKGKTTYVRDGDGTELGLLVDANWGSLKLLSSKSYIYTIQWDGTLVTWDGLYYSSSDCSGTPRVGVGVGTMSGKGIHVDRSGNLYKPTNPDANGNVLGTSFSYSSVFYYAYTTCTVTSNSTLAVELTPISRADAGIPDTITPQISIVSE